MAASLMCLPPPPRIPLRAHLQALTAAYLDRELARLHYFTARLVVRAEELDQKRAAADVAERAAAAAAAAREAELAGMCGVGCAGPACARAWDARRAYRDVQAACV